LTTPDNKLAPESQQWVRWIEGVTTDNSTNIKRFLQQQNNDNASQKSTMNLLQRGLTDLGSSINTYLATANIDASRINSGLLVRNVSNSSTYTSSLGAAVATVTGNASFNSNVAIDGTASITGRLTNLGAMTTLSGGWQNLYVQTATGAIGTVPSYRSAKKNYVPFTDTAAVLAIQAYLGHYNYQENDEVLKPYFIVDELEDAGLSAWVAYDENGVGKGINYDFLVVALQAVVKAQDARLTALEARVNALEISN
jgi:hypothetical protein